MFTQEFVTQLADKSISIAVLAVGWYFMIRYFMNQITLERQQNQSNLLQFVQLIKESNQVHLQTAQAVTSGYTTVADQVKELHRKFDDGRFCKSK